MDAKTAEAITAIENHLKGASDEWTDVDDETADSEAYGRHYGYLSGLASALDILKQSTHD